MPISNPKEEIDSRILSLIGLEDVFDLDYETYLTLLKEAMVKSRMTKKTIPTEEVMLLTEEYKRVKSKKDSGRFEVKKKKISASSFSVGGIRGQIAGTATKALPGTAIGTSPLSKGLEDNISTITSFFVSIAETLKQQKKVADDSSAYDKRKNEKEKRALAESKLEKRFEGLKKVAEKIIAPVKSLLDRIIQFFTTVIMGRIVYKLVEWLGDPTNASKVKSIIRFVKDWWPALLGSYILFGTSFGKLIRGTVGLVGRFIFQIGKVAIPQLLKFIKSPVGIGLGLFTAGATVPAMFPGTVNQQERQTSKQSGSKEDKIKSLQQQKANLNFFEKLQGKGSEIDEQVSYLQTGKTKSYGFSGGGLASGFVSGEKGVDKVPAMLSDGEFVMSRGAVAKYGVDTLEAMNAAGGGTNKPKVISGTTYAAGGGSIGSERYSLTPGFSGESSQSDIYLVRAVNELIKVLRNKYPDSKPSGSSYPSGSSGSSGGSGLSQQLANIAGEIASRSSQLYQGASSAANKGASLASKVPGIVAEKTKPLIEKAKPAVQSLPAKMDYGSLYLRSQFGGLGGSITEADLSTQTQNEYKKAFERAKADLPNRIAKSESVVRQYQGLLNAPNLTVEQKKDFNNKLANAKGELAKYKRGLVNVEYPDFVDEKGKLSPAAEAAQKTLGAVWASSAKDGGIKIEKEPYDFPLVKDPIGLIMWKQLSTKEKLAWLDRQNPYSAVRKKLDPRVGGSFGKWGNQDIAEAMYTLNPFATPVETDVKIGGKPRPKGILDKMTNILDNPLLSMSRGLAMNLLKGKERNVVTGEAEKGSFMDKLFPKKGPPLPKPGQRSGAVTMYKPNDPRRKQSGPYQSRFARPKNAGVRPVKPPSKPSVIYTYPQSANKNKPSSVYNRPSASKPPSFSASTKGSRPKINIFGIHI